jgi:hypothetical protein
MRSWYESREYQYSLFFEKTAKELTKFLVLFHIANLRIAPKSAEVDSEWQTSSSFIPLTFQRPTNTPDMR